MWLCSFEKLAEDFLKEPIFLNVALVNSTRSSINNDDRTVQNTKVVPTVIAANEAYAPCFSNCCVRFCQTLRSKTKKGLNTLATRHASSQLLAAITLNLMIRQRKRIQWLPDWLKAAPRCEKHTKRNENEWKCHVKKSSFSDDFLTWHLHWMSFVFVYFWQRGTACRQCVSHGIACVLKRLKIQMRFVMSTV